MVFLVLLCFYASLELKLKLTMPSLFGCAGYSVSVFVRLVQDLPAVLVRMHVLR
jgi:hypothetical protein